MPAGLQIFGPQGQIWFDTNDITTRTVGVYTITNGSPALPNIGPPNYSYYIDYACPNTTEPWAYYAATNGVSLSFEVNRINASTARLTFNLGYNTQSYPAGAVITVYYGWGPA